MPPLPPPGPPWTSYDDIPHAVRQVSDNLIQDFFNHSNPDEVLAEDVRRVFMNQYVFQYGRWKVTSWIHEPAWKIRGRHGAEMSLPLGTSIARGDEIFLKPSIEMDFPAFMCVRAGGTIASSSDVKLHPHFKDINEAKILAMQNWDDVETPRVTNHNLALTTHWVRKTLLKEWTVLSGDEEQAGRIDLKLDKGRLVMLKTMYDCLEATRELASQWRARKEAA